MKVPDAGERLLLHPGDYRVTDKPVMMSTLLGSCVAVCLYDPAHRVMGMNHFVLAKPKHSDKVSLSTSEAGRYGNHAMAMLMNDLLHLGAKRSRLQAKAFGGSRLLGDIGSDNDKPTDIGLVNASYVRDFLEHHNIPLVSADLGGNHGRQIHFSGHDYAVYLRRIPMRYKQRLSERKQAGWQDNMKAHEKR